MHVFIPFLDHLKCLGRQRKWCSLLSELRGSTNIYVSHTNDLWNLTFLLYFTPSPEYPITYRPERPLDIQVFKKPLVLVESEGNPCPHSLFIVTSFQYYPPICSAFLFATQFRTDILTCRYRGLSSWGTKRPECDAASNVEVKNVPWSYYFHVLGSLHGVVHGRRGNFRWIFSLHSISLAWHLPYVGTVPQRICVAFFVPILCSCIPHEARHTCNSVHIYARYPTLNFGGGGEEEEEEGHFEWVL